MKNIKPIAFIVAALTLLFVSAYPQQKLGGRVVEVLDGRTVAIELYSGGRLTAELQYIEVPEPEQQLHQTVKEHLQVLVLGKAVEFRPLRLIKARTVGQLFLKKIDVSQQMIRDGAAWYAAREKSGQEAAESEIYLNNEKLAKTERRGIWSVKNLKPAWEMRAEAEENRKRQEQITRESAAKAMVAARKMPGKQPQKPAVRRQMSSEAQMWAGAPDQEMPENVMNVGGLMIGYNPVTKIGIVATPFSKLTFADKNGDQAATIGIAYLYRDSEIKGRENVYLVGIESKSRDFKFLKFNELTVTADNQKIVVGKAKRTERRSGDEVEELLFYRIKRNVIAKIAGAKNVSVKVGTYSGKINSDVQMLLSNLLKASE